MAKLNHLHGNIYFKVVDMHISLQNVSVSAKLVIPFGSKCV